MRQNNLKWRKILSILKRVKSYFFIIRLIIIICINLGCQMTFKKIRNCLVGHFSFLILKGHHHERSIKQSPALHNSWISLDWSSTIFTIIGVPVQLLYGPTVSPYSCCTVPRCPRTATVRYRPCTLYTDDRHRR